MTSFSELLNFVQFFFSPANSDDGTFQSDIPYVPLLLVVVG